VADIRPHQWNHVRIVARGNHFQFFINGKLASEFTDNAKSGQLDHGAIGLQIHDKGMQVEFKDILLKQLETKGGMNFDKDGVFPPSQFVTHKDEHWIFYGAASERHYSIGRDQRKALNYDDKYYRAKEFAWVPSSLVSTKIMSWEMLFIDRETGEYTVDKFLDYGEKEYGGG